VSTERRRVLVTNDDGVEAPGLAALAAAMAGAGYQVVVAAPPDDRSGSSAAVGPAQSVEGMAAVAVEVTGFDGLPAYAVEGPPALAVMAARLGAFGPGPDLVVSGINPGPNTGQAVLHSGTVGAALAAANFGLSGLAVSLDGSGTANLPTAAAVARAAAAWLARAPAGTVLNVNVPDRPLGQVAGVRAARLARFGEVQAVVHRHEGGRVHLEIRSAEPEHDPESDSVLLADGFVTVTAIVGVREDGAGDGPAPAASIESALPGTH
jgi:5'-nucleotidase